MINQGNMRVSDRSIATDCLNSIKFMAIKDTISTMETATPQLRQAMIQMNRDHQQLAEEIFNYMYNKGWYLVPRSDHQVANQILNQFQMEMNPNNTLSLNQTATYQQYNPTQNFQS